MKDRTHAHTFLAAYQDAYLHVLHLDVLNMTKHTAVAV